MVNCLLDVQDISQKLKQFISRTSNKQHSVYDNYNLQKNFCQKIQQNVCFYELQSCILLIITNTGELDYLQCKSLQNRVMWQLNLMKRVRN